MDNQKQIKYHFTLYILGLSVNSQNSLYNLKQMCELYLKDDYLMEIVDVLENPELAETEKILATPTLVIHKPGPVKRLVGDLGNWDRLIELLGIDMPKHFYPNSRR
ncbi:MAG: circadian clock protein KaiB [Calditrichae bacterium]|nr:circadian clock protein KaiB [Calditrichia bacterium]